MYLPEDFITKYRNLLGEEADAFLETFEMSPISGFRTNPLKKQQQPFDDPIPDTPWGHYGKISGKSVEHVTGLVYSQEPAAQMVAQIAAPEPGSRVLDLAAAPGGKSTQLLSYLQNDGVLVSNEISRKRSQILVENLERYGAKNVVVTNESADRLAKVFSNYFDVIVLDAPCSGEGMFRKDKEAVKYWHIGYPAECARVQQHILDDTIKMLAPGGRLIYSTCTWSPEENEEIVKWLLDKYAFLELVNIPKNHGMADGIDMPQAARMYPHRFKGEGQFVAHLRDSRPAQRQLLKPVASRLTKSQQMLWTAFERDHLTCRLEGVLQTFGDHLYLLPAGLPDLSTLKIARNGLHLGSFKKNRFEPSFALGIALSPDDIEQKIEIDIEQFKSYVSGNPLTLSESYPTGWYQLVIKGNGIGFAKVVGTTVKNYFPKGLRFNS